MISARRATAGHSGRRPRQCRLALVERVAARGGKAHIPTQSRVRLQCHVPPNHYRRRNLIERFFCKLKHFGRIEVSPPTLLAILDVVSGRLSAVLTNDFVLVAMTPLLVSITLAGGLNPAPFLLAICFTANTGSAGTPIRGPQSMIAAQGLQLSVSGFLRVAALQSLLSLPIVWLVVALLHGKKWTLARWREAAIGPTIPDVALDRLGTVNAAVIAITVVLAFTFRPWPKETDRAGCSGYSAGKEQNRVVGNDEACGWTSAASLHGAVPLAVRDSQGTSVDGARRRRDRLARCLIARSGPALEPLPEDNGGGSDGD